MVNRGKTYWASDPFAPWQCLLLCFFGVRIMFVKLSHWYSFVWLIVWSLAGGPRKDTVD